MNAWATAKTDSVGRGALRRSFGAALVFSSLYWPIYLFVGILAPPLSSCGPTFVGACPPGQCCNPPCPLQGLTPTGGDAGTMTPNCVVKAGSDCDGDGYTYLNAVASLSDCDDTNPNANPGAVEFVNGIDDNCNGLTDECSAACDSSYDAKQPKSLAGAMDLCPPFLVDQKFNVAANPFQRAILSKYGNFNVPRSGQNFVLLSTGLATDALANPTSFVPPQPGTAFGFIDTNPLVLTTLNTCTSTSQKASNTGNDLVSMTMTVKAPTNAHAFSFDLNFFTAEYPEYVGKTFNDEFYVQMTTQKSPTPVNITYDMFNSPITVNGAFLSVCTNEPVCVDEPVCKQCSGKTCPAYCGHTCGEPCGVNCPLDGTGYDQEDMSQQMDGGATGWLRTTAVATPGDVITLTFVLFDGGDFEWDSSVLLDNFQWYASGIPGTVDGADLMTTGPACRH